MLPYFILGVIWSFSSFEMVANTENVLDNVTSTEEVTYSVTASIENKVLLNLTGRSIKKNEGCQTRDILLANHAQVHHPPGCTRGFSRNSICVFRCKKYFRIAEKYRSLKISRCNAQRQWEPGIPKCVPMKACPGPVFPHGLYFLKDCSKAVGCACRVSCEEGLLQYGRTFIVCQSNGVWSDIPNCGCSIPEVSESVDFNSDCSPYVGKSCHLKCQEGHEIDGPTFSTCGKDGNWSEMPKCVKKESAVGPNKVPCVSKCPRPSNASGLPREIVMELPEVTKNAVRNSCSHAEIPQGIIFARPVCRFEEQECHVSCRTPLFIPGAKFIKYIGAFVQLSYCSNGTWTNLPNCTMAKKRYWHDRMESSKCQKPITPENLIIKNCPGIGGSDCKVYCKEGYELVGPSIIKCWEGKWSQFPVCKSKR